MFNTFVDSLSYRDDRSTLEVLCVIKYKPNVASSVFQVFFIVLVYIYPRFEIIFLTENTIIPTVSDITECRLND